MACALSAEIAGGSPPDYCMCEIFTLFKVFICNSMQDMYGTCSSLHSLCIQAAKPGFQCAEILPPPRNVPACKSPESMRNPLLCP